MTRGYFCFAQGDEYVRHAYALALSLKATQSTVNKLSIGVEEGYKVDEKYRTAFDEIIEIPWGDSAKGDKWKLKNEWKVIHMTPYDETVKLDADMLFFDDVSHWWNVLSKSDMKFAMDVSTYRNETITSDYCRRLFTSNELPNVYSAFFYFKKLRPVYEFFALAEMMFLYWPMFAQDHLEAKLRPEEPTTDVVYALAYKLLNVDEFDMSKVDGVPNFVHMKTQLQNWNNPHIVEDWTDNVSNYFTPNCDLIIGGYRQSLPFHYHQKTFLTDEIISYLEAKA